MDAHNPPDEVPAYEALEVYEVRSEGERRERSRAVDRLGGSWDRLDVAERIRGVPREELEEELKEWEASLALSRE